MASIQQMREHLSDRLFDALTYAEVAKDWADELQAAGVRGADAAYRDILTAIDHLSSVRRWVER